MSIGERIKKIRSELGISRDKLAKSVGVSIVSVANWENEKNKLSGTTLVAVAAQLGVSVTWLQTGKGDPYSAQAIETLEPAPESQREKALLELFRSLTDDQKTEYMRSLEAQKQQNKQIWEQLSKVMGGKVSASR